MQQQALGWERADKRLVLQLLDGILHSVHKLESTPRHDTYADYGHYNKIRVEEVLQSLPEEAKWATWQKMFSST